MIAWGSFLCAVLLVPSFVSAEGEGDLLLVVGASGSERYGELFTQWSNRWIDAARRGSLSVTVLGGENVGEESPREGLRRALREAELETERPLWLVLIGHGTFDHKTARFNLRGPDVSGEELSEWLEPLRRPVAVVDCSACSAPILTLLSRRGRVVITATRSGGEENFAWFGEYLSRSLADPAADLDKDGQTSLWEAFLAGSRRTAESYQADGRLLTEHALLDDNGDKQGTRADVFRGLKLQEGVSVAAPLDGEIAHQWHLVPSDREARLPVEVRRRRDELERQVLALRQRKTEFEGDVYYDQLEPLLLELARLNHSARRSSEP